MCKCVCVCWVMHLCNVDPALDDASTQLRAYLPLTEDGADHARRNCIKLGDGGTDGGRALFAVLFITLRPDSTQTVMRNHLLKQQLWKEGDMS